MQKDLRRRRWKHTLKIAFSTSHDEGFSLRLIEPILTQDCRKWRGGGREGVGAGASSNPVEKLNWKKGAGVGGGVA